MPRAIRNDPAIWLGQSAEQQSVIVNLMYDVCYKETAFNIFGHVITLQPGQLVITLRSYPEKCGKGVSTQKLRTILKRLETAGFLTQKATQGKTLITLLHWEEYQNTGKEITQTETHKQHTSNTASTQEQHIKEESKKARREETNKGTNANDICMHAQKQKPDSVDEVKAYFLNKEWSISFDTHEEAEKFYDYNESTGWINDKGEPFKDWKRIADLWVKKISQYDTRGT